MKPKRQSDDRRRDSHDEIRLPGGLPIPALVLGVPVIAIALTGILVASRPSGELPGAAHAVLSAPLRFEDRPDGAVLVSRAPEGTPVAVLAPGSDAFVRVTLAGLVRERRREHQDAPSLPFTLTRWSDGRLTLDDTATHRLIELGSFGPDNEASFARLLDTATRAKKDGSRP